MTNQFLVKGLILIMICSISSVFIVPAFANDNAKNFPRWTIRVGIAHDSYAHTAPGNPSTTGPALQIQYNVSPTFFIQATITQNTIVYQTTNFMVFVGLEFHL